MSERCELKEKLNDLADKLTTPLMLTNPEEISRALQQLEAQGILTTNTGVRVYVTLRGEESCKNMSPYDPTTQKQYGFVRKEDAVAWANGLKPYLKIKSLSIE